MTKTLLDTLKDGEMWVGYFLLRIFSKLIDEFDHRKDYATLQNKICDLAEKPEIMYEIQALLCDILIYAMEQANGDSPELDEIFDSSVDDLLELARQTDIDIASTRERMETYLPAIGRMLAVLWLADDYKKTIRNDKDFYTDLAGYLTELSADVSAVVDGRIMLDPEYDFDFDLRLFEAKMD